MRAGTPGTNPRQLGVRVRVEPGYEEVQQRVDR
jgi:hypothetical protein